MTGSAMRRSGRLPVPSGVPRRGEQVLIAFGLLWLLVGPRIAVPGAAGVRVEDFVVAVLAIEVAIRFRGWRRLGAPGLGVVLVVGAGLLSAATAAMSGRVDPMTAALFAIRPLEYAVAFPAVLVMMQRDPRAWTRYADAGLAVVTVLQAFVGLLQYALHVEIGFSYQSYSRAAGLTAGPYELGAISAGLLVYWAWRRRPVLAGLALIALVISISRISLIGAALALVMLAAVEGRRRWSVMRDGRTRTRTWRPVVGIGAVVLVGVVAAGAASPIVRDPVLAAIAPMTERFETTSIVGSWTAAEPLAAARPPVETAGEYNRVAYDEIFQHVDARSAAAMGAEPSALVRFFRWHLILDNVDTPEEAVLGLGPSFAGRSVDGAYLRFFADGGWLGVAAWLFLLAGWILAAPLWLRGVVITFLVGSLFIDVVYAMRPMILLWAMMGLAASQPSSRHRGRLRPRRRAVFAARVRSPLRSMSLFRRTRRRLSNGGLPVGYSGALPAPSTDRTTLWLLPPPRGELPAPG